MKKQLLFIGAMMLLGVLAGLMAYSIITAIAAPNYSNMLLSAKENAEITELAASTGLAVKNTGLIRFAALLLIALIFVAFLWNINRHLLPSLLKKQTFLKALTGLVLALFLMVFIAALSNRMISSVGISWGYAGFVAVLFGFTFMVLGENGFAKDFTEMRLNGATRRDLLICFIQGIAAGLISILLLFGAKWWFGKFFVLVSEVYDGSGEVTAVGYRYFKREFIFLAVFLLGSFAALISSVTPVKKEKRERIVSLTIALILLAVLLIRIIPAYNEGVKKYDLGKKSLAEAAGIEDLSNGSSVLLVLVKGADGFAGRIEHDMMLNSYGAFTDSGKITVSPENLKKLEDFLSSRPNGSVYKFAALSALYNGYFMVFDYDEGMNRLFAASDDLVLARYIMIARLKRGRITEKNLEFIRHFADEGKFIANGNSAVTITELFIRYGAKDDASKWMEIAHERAESDKFNALKMPENVMVNGRISGNIDIGVPVPLGTRIGLFKYQGRLLNKSDLGSMMMMVDSAAVKEDGAFSFGNLAEDEYYLCLLTGKDIVAAAESAKVKIEFKPYIEGPLDPKKKPEGYLGDGIIKITAEAPSADLGKITLTKE